MEHFQSTPTKFVRDGAFAPWLGDEDDQVVVEIITAAETAEAEITDKELQSKTICAIPLLLKHGTASNVKLFERSSKIQFSNAPKRQRLGDLAKYDRLVEMGDLANGNRCFAILFRDPNNSRKYLRHCTDIPLIGTPVLLGSPKKSSGTLKSSMPLVEPDWPVVPLDMEKPDFVVKTELKEVCLVKPDVAGEMLFFIHHNEEISVSRFKYMTDMVSCTGRMCDRGKPNLDNVACGCLNNGFDSSATVAELTIEIRVPTSVVTSGVIDVEDFRS